MAGRVTAPMDGGSQSPTIDAADAVGWTQFSERNAIAAAAAATAASTGVSSASALSGVLDDNEEEDVEEDGKRIKYREKLVLVIKARKFRSDDVTEGTRTEH